MRLLCADPAPDVQESFRRAVRGKPGIELFVAGSLAELDPMLRRVQPSDVIILDADLVSPGRRLDSEKVAQIASVAPVVLLMTTYDHAVAREAAAVGAVACFPKDLPVRKLIDRLGDDSALGDLSGESGTAL